MSYKNDYNPSKSIFKLKNSSSFERLKAVVNSLNETDDNSIIKFDSNVDLNPEKVKTALEELIGGKDGIAYVVLDESGNLFSSSLLEEANASLNCLKKIKKILQGEDGKMFKPIVLITGKKQTIKVVIILPNEFQSIENSCSYPVVYSIDPSNGKRDLLNQTNNKILEMYLRKGSIENRVNPLFSGGIETSAYKSDVKKCVSEKESGWWCIYYCLFLIYDGNDNFLEGANWATINTEMIKTVLLTYIDALVNTEQNVEKKVKKEKNFEFIKKLNQIDDEIKTFFSIKERKIQENLDSIKNSSIDEKIKNILNEEAILNKAKEKLKKEIKELDDIIKQGEALVSSKNTFETTNSQFKRIVTGEEKALLEAKALKKEEKSKESILAYNENERKAVVEEEIKKLEISLNEEEKKINEKIREKDEIEKCIRKCNEDIKTNEKSIETYNTQISGHNSNLINYENQKKNFDTLKSEINRVLIDSHYKELFDKLLKNNTGCDANTINSLQTNLEACDKNISDYTSYLVWYDNEINSNNDKIAEKRILITSCNNSISDLNTNLSHTNSQVSHYAQKVEEYSGWFNSWWWKSDYESFSKSLSEWKSTQTQQTNKIAQHRTEISNHQSAISDLESKNTTHKTNKLMYQEKLEVERRNRLKYTDDLKKQRDLAINKITENIKALDENVKETQKNIGVNQVEIKSADDRTRRLKEEIERKNKELSNIQLSLTLNENDKKKIVDKINKAKEKLKKNEKETSQKIQEPIRVVSNNATSQNKLIDSLVLNDQSYTELMRLCKFKDQKWKLCYRATRDGFKGENFHNKCDGKSNTLTIIKTTNQSIFGGFTSATWSKNDGFKEDPYAFLFSYANKSNEKIIIKCSEPSNAIYCNENYGPCFGNDDIKISNMSNSNNESESVLGYVYGDSLFEYGSDESMNFLAGARFFQTEEIEVFIKDFLYPSDIELTEIEKTTKKDRNTIIQAYEIFHAMAINGKIDLESFIYYLMNKVKVFKDETEIEEMKELFEFIFKYFDEDGSGELEFKEFITCFSIFDTRSKKDIPILFFGFFFDYADKDKSQTLDIDEIDELISKFPSIFKKNKEIILLKKKLEKNNSNKKNSLTKTEFLSLFQDNKRTKQKKEVEEVMTKTKFIDSIILETDKLYYDLRSLCGFEDQKWKLIYRGTKDGFRAQDFHDKCDNVPNTLTIIKATNSNIFGGFTNAKWSKEDEFKEDPTAFIFSLTNKQNKSLVIDCTDPDHAIKCSEDHGPCFGDGDIVVVHGSNLNKRSKFVIGSSYSNPKLDENVTDTDEHFQTVEIEVFCKDYRPISREQIREIKKKYSLPEDVVKETYEKYNSIAINGNICKKKFLDFVLKLSSTSNEETEDIASFFKMITDHFDQNKTGKFNFNQFLECLNVLELSRINKQQFFELLFDMADQDKNQVLDLTEIKDLFNKLPSGFNKNEGLNYVIKKLEQQQTSAKCFTKDEFIEILEDIENDDLDD